MSFTVEKGIPLPEVGRSAKYPFSQMDIGDSVFIPHMSSTEISSRLAHHRKK
jgi:hypothetical protein